MNLLIKLIFVGVSIVGVINTVLLQDVEKQKLRIKSPEGECFLGCMNYYGDIDNKVNSKDVQSCCVSCMKHKQNWRF